MAIPRKILCQVQHINDHGDHVYTVDLVSDKAFPMFRPGQFLHLALDDYDPSGYWPESRVFSIASPAGQRERLTITYSVRGRFTSRMENELATGRAVWIKMPYGDFVVRPVSSVAMLAGGTGITAFTAFLTGLSSASTQTVLLAYGARKAELLVYRGLIEQCAAQVAGLRTWFYIEDGPLETLQAGNTRIGRLSLDGLWGAIADPGSFTFYLSGPPEMLRSFSSELRERGIGTDAIKVDAWE